MGKFPLTFVFRISELFLISSLTTSSWSGINRFFNLRWWALQILWHSRIYHCKWRIQKVKHIMICWRKNSIPIEKMMRRNFYKIFAIFTHSSLIKVTKPATAMRAHRIIKIAHFIFFGFVELCDLSISKAWNNEWKLSLANEKLSEIGWAMTVSTQTFILAFNLNLLLEITHFTLNLNINLWMRL